MAAGTGSSCILGTPDVPSARVLHPAHQSIILHGRRGATIERRESQRKTYIWGGAVWFWRVGLKRLNGCPRPSVGLPEREPTKPPLDEPHPQIAKPRPTHTFQGSCVAPPTGSCAEWRESIPTVLPSGICATRDREAILDRATGSRKDSRSSEGRAEPGLRVYGQHAPHSVSGDSCEILPPRFSARMSVDTRSVTVYGDDTFR